MTTSPSHRRTSALAAVLVAAALVVSACGGDGADASDGPSTTPSTTAAASPTPTPTPSVTPPLSPFEDRPQVKALREFFSAVGQAVNAGDKALSTIAPLATPAGLESTRGSVSGDLEHGYHWPGPEPFTPTAVRSARRSATVSTCMLSTGWSVDPATGKPVGGKKARSVKPIQIGLKKAGGRWKVDAILLGTGDCGSVDIKEVRW